MATRPATTEPAPTVPTACANCGANLEGLGPDIAACPDCAQPVGAPRARFCIGCGYDLVGIDASPAKCPECGRGFDPQNPSTTAPVLLPSILVALARRCAVPTAVILLVVTGVVHTIIPRPADLSDWRLWLWLGHKYGVEARWTSSGSQRVHWWADRITSVQGLDSAEGVVWEVSWQWPDLWTVRASRAGVRWQDLSASFTEMKREMFGVTIGPAAKETTEGPLEFVGTKVDVFSGLVSHFGVQVSPFLLRNNQSYVWIFDRELGRMLAISREKAAAMGYDLRLWRAGQRSEPLVAPPAERAPGFEQAPATGRL